MYCMKCGTELPNDARFCFKCGTAIFLPSSARENEANKAMHPHISDSVTNIDMEATTPSEMEIKGIVGQLYKDFDALAEKLSKNFVDTLRKRYGASANSLASFIQKAPADIDQLFAAIDEYIFGFFKNQGIYHIPMSSVRTATRKYSLYWPSFYKEANSVYQGIELNQQQMKEYREIRKASRSRLIGGGFGFKGAIKGIAAAGTVNMTTGMAHSIVNAAGNASSAKDAAFRKEVYFKSSDFKETLQWCIQEDCRAMQKAISDLWSTYARNRVSIP